MQNNKKLWAEICRHINASEGEDQAILDVKPVHGGDISQAFHLRGKTQDYFVKLNDRALEQMFHQEYLALTYMAEFSPRPICVGTSGQYAFLVLEFLPITHSGNVISLAELVAKLHNITYEQFGWYDDNTIGSTRQINTWSNNWATFWCEHRLRPQMQWAIEKGFSQLVRLQSPLLEACQNILKQHECSPSLVHGDLWSGNKAFLENGEAIIYDPAAYYGDKEVDIAMTELFGGFNDEFYRAYYQHHPKQNGYGQRKRLYNLYHLLNHLNLFGESYLSQCLNSIDYIINC